MPYALDPAVRHLIAELNALGDTEADRLADLSPEQARAWFTVLRGILSGDSKPLRIASVRQDTVVHAGYSVPVRIYDTPESSILVERLVIYIHGGGWVVGDLDSADSMARTAADQLNARVVSVDYRLAPEHPFPAAYEDCAAVLVACARRHPAACIAVIGDSAGANLAGALCAESRIRNDLRVDSSLLLYPALDPLMRSSSMQSLAEGYILTQADMAYYWASYLADPVQATDPRATPAALTDLSGMPNTVLVTAGFDPLRDEGREYARRLVDADVLTVYLPFPALVHGFIDMVGRVPAAESALRATLSALATIMQAAASDQAVAVSRSAAAAS
jgi:acetyl esterase